VPPPVEGCIFFYREGREGVAERPAAGMDEGGIPGLVQYGTVEFRSDDLSGFNATAVLGPSDL